jgi:hypothetical protein
MRSPSPKETETNREIDSVLRDLTIETPKVGNDQSVQFRIARATSYPHYATSEEDITDDIGKELIQAGANGETPDSHEIGDQVLTVCRTLFRDCQTQDIRTQVRQSRVLSQQSFGNWRNGFQRQKREVARLQIQHEQSLFDIFMATKKTRTSQIIY